MNFLCSCCKHRVTKDEQKRKPKMIEGAGIHDIGYNLAWMDCKQEELSLPVKGRQEQALLSINVSNTVIATGGSAVYSSAAMEHLAEGSKVVYLKVSLEDLEKRLTDIKGRGVVLRAGESLEAIFEIRTKLYEKFADITVEEDGDSFEDTVRAVLESL